MEKLLISIIIPVYNTELYLEKCLESVVNQTYQNIEIIIVNDGSTDGSAIIANKYNVNDKRIRLIDKTNEGIASARNIGLSQANGDYIMFVDSDDWLEEDTCAKAMEHACRYQTDMLMWSYKREYDNETYETKLLGDNVIIWDKNSISQLYRKLIGLVKEELRQPQKIDSLVTVWGKLYRKECIKNIFFEDIRKIGSEDTWFNIQVFQNLDKAMYIPDCLYHYRKNNQQSQTKRYKNYLVHAWKNLYDCIEILIKGNHMEEIYEEALFNRITLGLIGVGLNLAEDKSMSFKDKIKELSKILRMPHYIKALEKLELSYLPVHWKVFFICAKKRYTYLMYLLLIMMNYLRG